MTATRTRPLRIRLDDHEPIRLLAEIRRLTPADVVHDALREYLISHRADFARRHAETTRLILAGDIDALAAALEADVAGEADRIARELDRVPAGDASEALGV